MLKFLTLQEPITKISAVILGRPMTLELALPSGMNFVLIPGPQTVPGSQQLDCNGG